MFTNLSAGQIGFAVAWFLMIGLSVNLYRWCKYDKALFWGVSIGGALMLSLLSSGVPIRDQVSDIYVYREYVDFGDRTYCIYAYNGARLIDLGPTKDADTLGHSAKPFKLSTSYSFFGFQTTPAIIEP